MATAKSASSTTKTRIATASKKRAPQRKAPSRSTTARTKKTTPAKAVKPKRKATIVDTFKKQEKKPFTFPTRITLAIVPAVHNLPINPDALAIAIARYSGYAVVLVGAVFSLYFVEAMGLLAPGVQAVASVANSVLPFVSSVQSQPAEVISLNAMSLNFTLLTASLFIMATGMTLLIFSEYLEHERKHRISTTKEVEAE